MVDNYESIVRREIEALEDREQWLAEFTVLTTEASTGIIDKVYQQLEAQNRRVEVALSKAPHPEPQATLRELLIGIAATLTALTILTLYTRATNPPSCPPHINRGTLENPIFDDNWRIDREGCKDSRDTLSKLLKPMQGIFR